MALRQTLVLPSGQQVRDVVLHTPDEINTLLSTLDPYMYGVGVDLFEECPNKFICTNSAVDFKSQDTTFGVPAYRPFDENAEPKFYNSNGDPVSAVDRNGNLQNTRCLYIIGVRSLADWTVTGVGNNSMIIPSVAQIEPNAIVIGPYDSDYRKLIFYKVCVRTDTKTTDTGETIKIDPPPVEYPPINFPTETLLGSGQIYADIDPSDILTDFESTSKGLWTNNSSRLVTPNTSSLESSASANYLLEVYNNPQNNSECYELQYKIIYADYDGKGDRDLGGKDNQTLTKAMYTQYANILLPAGQKKFNFNGEDEDYVYIIDIVRDRYNYALDPGNWQMTLASCSFSNDTGKDSILENMQTASFQNNILTLVDALTGESKRGKSVYYSSKPYDVVIGTLEDGTNTLYVTASIAAPNLATPGGSSYIVQSNAQNANTVVVQGSRVYYWGLDGTVVYRVTNGTGSLVDITPSPDVKNANPQATLTNCRFTMSLNEVVSEYGYKLAKYSGAWTGSFTLPVGATVSPTIMSGSCSTEIYYTGNTNQIQSIPAEAQRIEGLTFDRLTSALSSKKQKLTVNSYTYNGALKWATQGQAIGNLINNSPITYNTPVIRGNFTTPVTLAFVTDTWGVTNVVDNESFDDLEDVKDLDDGFILIPIRKDSFGKVYPNHGIIVLSGKRMDGLGFNTNRSVEKNGYNTYRLFHSMKLVLDNELTDLSGDKLGFIGRSVDLKYNQYCFIRVGNRRFNYSNNPTYQSGSLGDIIPEFKTENKAYFTSIGIYNQNKELLAVGKISKALISSMTKESLFTVKIGQ